LALTPPTPSVNVYTDEGPPSPAILIPSITITDATPAPADDNDNYDDDDDDDDDDDNIKPVETCSSSPTSADKPASTVSINQSVNQSINLYRAKAQSF